MVLNLLPCVGSSKIENVVVSSKVCVVLVVVVVVVVVVVFKFMPVVAFSSVKLVVLIVKEVTGDVALGRIMEDVELELVCSSIVAVVVIVSVVSDIRPVVVVSVELFVTLVEITSSRVATTFSSTSVLFFSSK